MTAQSKFEVGIDDTFSNNGTVALKVFVHLEIRLDRENDMYSDLCLPTSPQDAAAMLNLPRKQTSGLQYIRSGAANSSPYTSYLSAALILRYHVNIDASR